MAGRRDLLAQLFVFAKELRRVEDAAAAAHGVTMWQYALLATVTARPGLNQAEAATALDYSRNRIIADIDALEERGLLVRARGADRRANVLRATDAGVDLMRRVRADIHRGEDELLTGLTAAERHDLDRVAHRIARAMQDRRNGDRS